MPSTFSVVRWRSSGDTVVVGADGEESNATGINGDQEDNNVPGSGAVYIFTGANRHRVAQYLNPDECRRSATTS